MVVQLIEKRLKSLFQVGKVHHPPRLLAQFTADMNLNAKRVTMHATTFVPFWNPGQEMGRFNLENAKYIHAAIVRTGVTWRKP